MTQPFLLFESGLLSTPGIWDGITKKLPSETHWYVNDRGAQSAFDAALRKSDYPSVLRRLRDHMPSVRPDSPIIVVGHSVGALLARAHANALGARVGGLVLIDPAPPAQFERGVDQVYHYLRLRQNLALQALRSTLRVPRTGRKLVDPNVFPESAREEVGLAMQRPAFWIDGYRECAHSGSDWLGAALYPDVETRPVAIVSSDVSTNQRSIQNIFESQVMDASTESRQFRADGATHQSVLVDDEHSRSVIAAIDWVTERVGR
jgi:pimeloyl-ACP methyl ester carboxylesterase